MPRRFLFEHKREPVVPYVRFLQRMLWCILLAAGLLSATILVGVIGFHHFHLDRDGK